MFLCKKFTDHSLKTIGLHFGGRDHSTVIHALSNVEIMLEKNTNIKEAVDIITRKIETIDHFGGIRVSNARYMVVDPIRRNENIGYNLMRGTLNYLNGMCDVMRTGLELHNMPSLNLHSKIAFKYNYSHNLFHWWGDRST